MNRLTHITFLLSERWEWRVCPSSRSRLTLSLFDDSESSNLLKTVCEVATYDLSDAKIETTFCAFVLLRSLGRSLMISFTAKDVLVIYT